MPSKQSAIALAGIGLLALCGNVWAETCCDPASPFVLGEAFPEVPATCETVGRWIDSAPEIDARISFTIVGLLVEVHWDGALAYLIMCEPAGVQVMCVTYSTNDLKAGDEIMLAGGYSRVGEKQIMLDPCLPYDASWGQNKSSSKSYAKVERTMNGVWINGVQSLWIVIATCQF